MDFDKFPFPVFKGQHLHLPSKGEKKNQDRIGEKRSWRRKRL